MSDEKNNIIGFVGQLTPNRISGWVCYKDSPTKDESLMVELYIGSTLINKVKADRLREDLREKGYHKTGKCGYEFELQTAFEISFLIKNARVVVEGVELQKTPNIVVNDVDYYFFIHIPKTAGTAFRMMLYDQFSQREMFPNMADIKEHNGYPELNVYGEKNKRDRDDIRFLFGHYSITDGDIFPKASKKLLFLRDPVERAMSNLFHLQKYIAKDQSLDEVYTNNIGSIDNIQVRYLAGEGATKKWKVDKSDLDKALANLKNCHFVGIKEHFPESIQLLRKIFNWNIGEIRSDNINKSKNQDLISYRLGKKIEKLNRFDEELYKLGMEIFRKNCRKYSIKIEENQEEES